MDSQYRLQVATDNAGFELITPSKLLIDGVQQNHRPESDATYAYLAPQPSPVSIALTGPNAFGLKKALDIVVGASTATKVRVDINGKYQGSVLTPAASTQESLQLTRMRLPQGAPCLDSQLEKAAKFDIRVSFDPQAANTKLFLLVATGDDSAGSQLVRVEDKVYTGTAKTFRTAIYAAAIFAWCTWLLVKGSAELASGVAPLLLALVYSAITNFVPKDWVQNLSPNELIRKSFGYWSKLSSRVVMTAFVVLTALGTIGVFGIALYANLLKQAYVEDVQTILDDRQPNYNGILDAMQRLPWRREAFLLYEIKSGRLKSTSDQRPWRQKVRELVESPKFQQAMNEAAAKDQTRNALEWILLKGGRKSLAYQDPVLTLAHILPEAEDDNETKFKIRAIEFLHKARPADCQANLLRFYIELDVAPESAPPSGVAAAWPRTQTEVVRDLALEVERKACQDMVNTWEYVAATDRLAYERLRQVAKAGQCQAAAMNAVESAITDVLEIQVRRSSWGDRLVWRSPGKLNAFRLWRYFEADGKPDRDALYGRYFQYIKPELAVCKGLSERLKDLFDKRSKLTGGSAKWIPGTALGSLEEFVRKDVEKDWTL